MQSGHFLVLASPCSLDGGFRSRDFAAHLSHRIKNPYGADNETIQSWRSQIIKLLPGGCFQSSGIPNLNLVFLPGGNRISLANPDQVYNAVSKGQETEFSDKTNMVKDLKIYEHLCGKIWRQMWNHNSGIATEKGADEIGTNFFSGVQEETNCTIVLTGHGFGSSVADALKTDLLRGDLSDTIDKMGMTSASLKTMLKYFCDEGSDKIAIDNENWKLFASSLKVGSINSFSQGFISPAFALEALRRRDDNAKSECCVTLIVDACHSGGWYAHFKSELANDPFDKLSLILQTACDANESAFEGIHTTANPISVLRFYRL